MLLVGPVGTGKSSALRMAMTALSGAANLLANNVLITTYNSLNDQVAQVLVKSRLVTWFELDLVNRDIAESIGTKTPATVLPYIRDIDARTLPTLEQMRNLQLEVERDAATRHKEICTLLIGLMKTSVKGGSASESQSENITLSTGKEQYYYGSTSLTLSASEHPQFQNIQSTDSTLMDMKDWYVLAGHALNASKASKTGLHIPKPSDEDLKAVCRVLAASAPERRPRFQASNIYSLLSECPGIINIVEWFLMKIVFYITVKVFIFHETIASQKLLHQLS
jgi:hypothetical protein